MGTLAPGHLGGTAVAVRALSSSAACGQRFCLNAAGAGAGRRRASQKKATTSASRSARGGSARSAWEGPSTSMSPVSMSAGTPRFDVDPAAILFSQRMVFLGSQVDDVSADWVISQLLILDAQDPTADITLLINSPGGSVTAGMGIYDAMKLCRADVSTVCFGLAASMGAFLLSAGTKGKRYCMPNARVMIHQPLGGAQGSAIDVGLQVREMMYHKVKLNKILSRATGQPEAKVEEDTDRDNFMSAWEAVEYGLVDAVLGGDNPNLIAPIGEVKEPAKTKVWDLWTVKVGKERRRLPGEQNLLESASS